MDKKETPIPNETEETTSAFSIKTLAIRLICLVALGYAIKVTYDRGQFVFAAVITVCLAGFFFSLIMYLVKVFKGEE